MKTLVVVYSRTGITLSLAKKIARELQADLEIIRDNVNRKGVLGFLRSGYEAVRKKIPSIAEPKHDPADYDLVIIGTPIWAGRMSSPVRAYLLRFRERFKQVAFFATSGRGGYKRAFIEMAEVAGMKPLATVDFSSRQVREGKDVEALEAFLRAIK